jgi:aminoglycoside N3'-acetyltransferase
VRTRTLVPGRHDRHGFLGAHLKVLEGLVDGRSLWFPTFNYDFLSTRVFDADDDPGQVGSLNEFARTTHAGWRTAIPVFNFAGTGPTPPQKYLTDRSIVYPFDESSLFSANVGNNGTILWYGAPFSTATILHHAESKAGGPAYRYDKDFQGMVSSGGTTAEVTLRYHVRPLDYTVDYDWDRIVSDASSQGIIRCLDDSSSIYWASSRALVDFWVEQQRKDPLYLLDAKSREWIAPRLEHLGRRFEFNDFEGDDQ